MFVLITKGGQGGKAGLRKLSVLLLEENVDSYGQTLNSLNIIFKFVIP